MRAKSWKWPLGALKVKIHVETRQRVITGQGTKGMFEKEQGGGTGKSGDNHAPSLTRHRFTGHDHPMGRGHDTGTQTVPSESPPVQLLGTRTWTVVRERRKNAKGKLEAHQEDLSRQSL
jgi:hypothetical protein